MAIIIIAIIPAIFIALLIINTFRRKSLQMLRLIRGTIFAGVFVTTFVILIGLSWRDLPYYDFTVDNTINQNQTLLPIPTPTGNSTGAEPEHESKPSLETRFWDLTLSNGSGSKTTSFFLGKDLPDLWSPTEAFPGPYSDRILAQLVFGMELHDVAKRKGITLKSKKLKVPNFGIWYMPWSRSHNLSSFDCPGFQDEVVGKCDAVDSGYGLNDENADVIVETNGAYFHSSSNKTKFKYILESPPHSMAVSFNKSNEKLASYARFSDMTTPYGKWVYFDPSRKFMEQEKDYSKGKRKMAVALVSHCSTRNNRMEFINLLRKYIDVDVIGSCGNSRKGCERSQHSSCLKELSKEYRFHLSFENSNCRHYITEKTFERFGYDILPVVLGAHPADYAAMCPERSYIHVEDFRNMEELAKHLHYLAKNPKEYNSYFQWKGTGKFINTLFFCRLCTLALYADLAPMPENRESPLSFHINHCLPQGEWYWLAEKRSINSSVEASSSSLVEANVVSTPERR